MIREGDITDAGRRKRVFLVDHFAISRIAVSEWLKETPDLTVCGEADNAASALTAIGNLKPDIIVTEIIRQQDLGFIHGLRSRYPRLPILVFSFRDEEWYAPRVLDAGASGFLTKAVGKRVLLDGIRSMLAGRLVLSREMRRLVLRRCRSHSLDPSCQAELKDTGRSGIRTDRPAGEISHENSTK
jgi:DNA-binding NarL/FixJ family response regulator